MRVSSIRWGVIWIGIGLLFLAINLELLDSLVFPRLFSLWPILLVAIGVEIMFRRTKLYFLALLSPLLIAGAFMAAASARGDWGWRADEFWHRWEWDIGEKKVFVSEIPADSTIRFLELDLECGPSQVSLRPADNQLFKATTEYYKRSPWIEHYRQDETEKIEYSNREKTRLTLLGLNIAASKNEFWIADFLPLKINISALDKEPDFDFSGFRLSSLTLDVRSEKTSIRLGNLTDTVDVDISGRTEELRIFIPDDFGLTVTGDSARLHSLLDGSGLLARDGVYHSEGYSDSARKVRFVLGANIGSLSIVRD